MASEFYVRKTDLIFLNGEQRRILEEEKENIFLGTSYRNGEITAEIKRIVKGSSGTHSLETMFHLSKLKEALNSGKKYFSKWDNKTNYEFFDKKIRFSWKTPGSALLLLPPEEDEQIDFNEDKEENEIFQFWDSILLMNTLIYHGTGHPIKIWYDLKNAIYGPGAYMKESKFDNQGTNISFRIKSN